MSGNLTKRQLDLLGALGEAQESVPAGQPVDFLTISTFEGTDILLPTQKEMPLNRQDLDELIDQGLVRVTKMRDHGDVNGHVTNLGYARLESNASSAYPHQGERQEPLFDSPTDVPTAFISYSHDSDEHKTWVRAGLAERLMAAGIRVVLDQWHLKYGADLTYFMENAARADSVLLVCTPMFAAKANARKGGVGYESSIVTAEMLQRHPSVEPKFVPIWRAGEREAATPHYLQAMLAVDLRNENPDYEREFVSLLRQLHKVPEHVPPALGQRPKFE